MSLPLALYPDFLPEAEADALLAELLADYPVTVPPPHGRLGAYFFGDPECMTLKALPELWGARSEWPASLRSVRDRIADLVGVCFEVTRTIYYANGEDEVGYHSDLPAYGRTDTIASLSLGAERNFALRRVADPEDLQVIRLPHGSLVVMLQGCQESYEHALLPEPECHAPRLNLTFRRFGW